MSKAKHSYCQTLRILPILAIILVAITSGCQHKSSDASDNEISVVSDSIEEAVIEEMPETIATTPHSKAPEDLKEFMNESEDSEKYAEGIIPLIIEESPEYAYKLLCSKFDKFIAVDKGRMKVILFDKYGRTEKTYGMACAKNYGTKHKKGDSCTPEGFFSVEGIYDSTDWLFTDDNGVTSDKKGQFGPRFIRIKIPTTSQIGIHGTCAPWSIGSRASHGCIRIKNENILELVELVEPGMPVIIVPGRKDMEQNAIEDADITWIPTTKTAKKPSVKILERNEQDKISTDTILTMPGDSIEAITKTLIENNDSISATDNPISTEL
ncbi:MAG: L,D-transpeptidase [Muribaculaceae bacterium]|nr:L,D-transpeptidase [Muribaculaceae bacterium]